MKKRNQSVKNESYLTKNTSTLSKIINKDELEIGKTYKFVNKMGIFMGFSKNKIVYLNSNRIEYYDGENIFLS